jgi:hypothetical protein
MRRYSRQAVETDVGDICIIEFDDNMTPEFFKSSEYVIDDFVRGLIPICDTSGTRPRGRHQPAQICSAAASNRALVRPSVA